MPTTNEFFENAAIVERIVSGGQTGVDQGALLAAIDLQIEHGGWCPKGRICEDGQISLRFQLKESHSSKYSIRTEQNVIRLRRHVDPVPKSAIRRYGTDTAHDNQAPPPAGNGQLFDWLRRRTGQTLANRERSKKLEYRGTA